MLEQEIQRKIEDLRSMGLPDYVPRETPVHTVKNAVSTIIGARRTGKTYRAWQLVDELIKGGKIASIRNVCALDFDNPVLSEMDAKDIKRIPAVFLKISPGFELKTPLVFIFDEIHKIPGWEQGVIELSRNPNWRVVVTGSSSKLLKDDIATELRGKSVSTPLYPLSFREFLRFKQFDGNIDSTPGQAAARRHFDEYLKWGGYPAVVFAEEISKPALLREYFDTMILRDIIQRHDVGKPRACIQALGYLLSNISRPMTSHAVYRFIKESGLATSRNAIGDYIRYAEDSWFIFLANIFSRSRKERERNYKKPYSIDWALASQNSQVWDGSGSQPLENMVYLHLVRNFARVHYYLTRSKRQEVDFIALDAHGRPQMAVQVSLDISRKETLAREIVPLAAAAKYFGIKENLLITVDHEGAYEHDGVKIRALPAWKWLLDSDVINR